MTRLSGAFLPNNEWRWWSRRTGAKLTSIVPAGAWGALHLQCEEQPPAEFSRQFKYPAFHAHGKRRGRGDGAFAGSFITAWRRRFSCRHKACGCSGCSTPCCFRAVQPSGDGVARQIIVTLACALRRRCPTLSHDCPCGYPDRADPIENLPMDSGRGIAASSSRLAQGFRMPFPVPIAALARYYYGDVSLSWWRSRKIINAGYSC